MGVEQNPQKVDDLNELWPAKEEPVKEGYLHIQNIKKSVKARANTAGIHGVTTLSSALDSDAEDKAATPKAVKAVKAVADAAKTTADQTADDLTEALENLDTSVGRNDVPVDGLWAIAAGDKFYYRVEGIFPKPRNNTFQNVAQFYVANSGVCRVKLLLDYGITTSNGFCEVRILKGQTEVFRTTSGNQANPGATRTYTVDLTVEPTDVFVIQTRVDITFAGEDYFELRRVDFLTDTNPPLAFVSPR